MQINKDEDSANFIHTVISDPAKNLMDAFSVGTVLATIAGILPSIAALFTVIWTGIRIYETSTVQRLLRKRLSSEASDDG